jgi:hypothetical protein
LADAGYFAIAPDQRGYSPGARPDPKDLDAYHIDRLVGDALDIVAAAGHGGSRFHLVGHDDDLSFTFDELTRDRFLLGSSDEVTEQIVGYKRRLGVNRMILSVHWVGMPHSQVVDTLNLFAAEVMPKVAQAL